MAIVEADAQPLTQFEQDVAAMQRYFDSPRFDGIIRLYAARQVVEQRGTIPTDFPVAREAATAFYDRLRELFREGTKPSSEEIAGRIGFEPLDTGPLRAELPFGSGSPLGSSRPFSVTQLRIRNGSSCPRIAVGMPITGHPPHRSGQARFEHPVLTSGV